VEVSLPERTGAVRSKWRGQYSTFSRGFRRAKCRHIPGGNTPRFGSFGAEAQQWDVVTSLWFIRSEGSAVGRDAVRLLVGVTVSVVPHSFVTDV
jgi:hypothetical protein